ncbi:MAG TPA: FAD-binding oxidoreductase, partial [Steroidobacteraceae bacterium]|nr:FAD-binding oxidoreductase [Steroidobacteraceae bacterium]
MSIESDLLNALPGDVIVSSAEIEPRYLGDWIHHDGQARPAALARPRTTAEVSTVLSRCQRYGVPVVPQGGRTGLAGGATPGTGSVILSMERMRSIEAVDVASSTIAVEAGAVLEAVQRAADSADLLFPLDIGGRGSCTIGGNIST